jgi:YbgC/YbaW family acyl-CoA thioester hydrolase
MQIETQHRVHMEHTDMQGVVNHAQYIHWMGWARSAFWSQVGYDEHQAQSQGLSWRLTRVECRYHDNVGLGTDVQQDTMVSHSGVRVRFQHHYHSGGRTLARAESELCLINSQHQPQRLPPEILKGLT